MTDTPGTPTDPTITAPDRRGSGAFKWDLAGADEIPMWVADMDFAVAPAITAALRRRVDHPVFGYTGVPDSYLDAVVEWERTRNDWPLSREQLVVVPSVMPALAAAVAELTRPGDRVATFSPVYFPFFDVVEQQERVLVQVPLAERTAADGWVQYAIDADALAAGLRGASLLLFCSPHNPGGRVWSADELATVCEVARREGVSVVSDEIHSDLVFPGERFVPWLTTGGATDRDMALIAPSKTFNIPGLPTATAIVPDPAWRDAYRRALAARMLKLPNLLAITAAEAAYRGAGDWLDAVRRRIHEHYLLLRELLADEPGVRVHTMEGTFIAWIDFRGRWERVDVAAGRDEASLSRRFGTLARRHGVWLSDGRQFGPEGEGFMRMNLATSRENVEEGIRRLRRALAEFAPQ